MGEVVADGHSHAQDEAAGVAFEHGLHVALGLGVEALVEVGHVLFGESDAGAERMFVVVFEDAARGVDGAVDVALVAQVGEVQRANDVGPYGVGPVIFAPVDVGAAGDAGGHEDVGGLDCVEFGCDGFAVFAAGRGEHYFYAFGFQQDGHFAADPACLAAVDERFG